MLLDYFVGVIIFTIFIVFHTLFMRKDDVQVEDLVMGLTGWVGMFAFVFISTHELFCKYNKKYRLFVLKTVIKNKFFQK